MTRSVLSDPGTDYQECPKLSGQRCHGARRGFAKATELLNAEAYGEAEAYLRVLLDCHPNEPNLTRLFGVALAGQNRWEQARQVLQRLVDAVPDFAIAHENLADVLLRLRYRKKSAQHLLLALEHDPGSHATGRKLADLLKTPGTGGEFLSLSNVEVLHQLGAQCLKRHDLVGAEAWLKIALTGNNGHVPSLLNMGHVMKATGRQQEAVRAYERCISLRPDLGEAYWSLANLKTFRFADHQLREMQTQLSRAEDAADGEDAAIAFLFALGKAAEDRQDYATAFAHYQRGNNLKKSRVRYDSTEFQKTIDRIKAVYSKSYFASVEGKGCQDRSPILIVGLPRSGSTLLEQILASHSQVEGTAELPYLLNIATGAGDYSSERIPYPACMRALEPGQLKKLGEAYLDRVSRHRSGAGYFTDKMPNNFLAIGFLHAVLPNAKVIDARRHPLDSCFGAYRQLFAQGQSFSYDLRDLAHYYKQYQSLMDHWAEVLPGKVLTIHYEDVVDDLEGQARLMARHCGLGWEESMLRFYETRRAVMTASSQQVRLPIYLSSVHFWRNYESQLDELIDYLEPCLAALR